MSHITSGDRVFIVGSETYGDVTRTTFLGKTGAVLLDDDNVLKALCEEDTNENVVNKTTGVNGKGVPIDLPMDVRKEGISILEELNIEPEQQKLMFSKFMVIFTKDERKQYVLDWNVAKEDPVQKVVFLNNLIDLLNDDETFISIEGQNVLIDIEPEIQQKMFSRFLTTVDQEAREAYILEWLLCKNDNVKKDDFLQKMYELLMEDDDYIQMEGRKALSEINMSYNDQVSVFAKYLNTTTSEERSLAITEWRKVRRSSSQRTVFLKSFIALNTEED